MTFLSASKAIVLVSNLFWFFLKSKSVAIRAISEWRYWERMTIVVWNNKQPLTENKIALLFIGPYTIQSSIYWSVTVIALGD